MVVARVATCSTSLIIRGVYYMMDRSRVAVVYMGSITATPSPPGAALTSDRRRSLVRCFSTR